MRCQNCGFNNDPEAGFCEQCGVSLSATACPNCGKVNEPDATFCEQCGQALRQPAAPPVQPVPVQAQPAPKARIPGWVWGLVAGIGVLAVGAVLFVIYVLPRFGTVTPVAVALPPTTTSPSCANDLIYKDDLNYPDGTTVQPGASFDKQWLLQNTGTCAWTDGYHLAPAQGDSMGAAAEQVLPAADAGAQVVVTIRFTAPSTPGTYRSSWQAVAADGKAFGGVFYVEIVVPSTAGTTGSDLWIPQFRLAQPFQAGFWKAGTHTYSFRGTGVSGCELESDPVSFDVSDTASLYPGLVYLRTKKLSQTVIAGDEFFVIHHQQLTMPVISFLTDGKGMARADAQATLDSCTYSFRYDNGAWQELKAEQLVEWVP